MPEEYDFTFPRKNVVLNANRIPVTCKPNIYFERTEDAHMTDHDEDGIDLEPEEEYEEMLRTWEDDEDE